MKILDILDLAYKAGFRGEDLITAAAIALAESGGNPDAVGDIDLADETTWGPSIGLWQIRSLQPKALAEATGADKMRDQNKLFNPSFNAQAAYAIYKQYGFSKWSTYMDGTYTEWVEKVNKVYKEWEESKKQVEKVESEKIRLQHGASMAALGRASFTTSSVGKGGVPCTQLSTAGSTPPFSSKPNISIIRKFFQDIKQTVKGVVTQTVKEVVDLSKKAASYMIKEIASFADKLWDCVESSASERKNKQAVQHKHEDGETTEKIKPSSNDCKQINKEEIIFVNGILTDSNEHDDGKQKIANIFCRPVIGVYNKSEGFVKDIGQAIGDKTWPLTSALFGGGSANKSMLGLYNLIRKKLEENKGGDKVIIFAHSQGAIITSKALWALWIEALFNKDLRSKLKNITVVTAGGAATLFPPGPDYRHWVLFNDLVTLFGKNPLLVWNMFSKNIQSKTAPCIWAHGLETYLQAFKEEAKKLR